MALPPVVIDSRLKPATGTKDLKEMEVIRGRVSGPSTNLVANLWEAHGPSNDSLAGELEPTHLTFHVKSSFSGGGGGGAVG